MTTATHAPYSYSHDPSGAELRKALLVPPRSVRRVDPSVLLAGASTLTLLAGIVRALGL